MENIRIGPYRVVRELAEDRVGRVFEAVDRIGKKPVLIKKLRPEIANEPGAVTRLYAKAQTLALLNHEHIARLFGFIRRDDGIYLVMESVKGENLQTLLKEKGRLDVSVALAFFRQVLSAVEFAHRLGVIHGELKSANILVTDFARIKILDFALGIILASPDRSQSQDPGGVSVDARSDIYSLGGLLYEWIVGRAPCCPDKTKQRAEATPLPPSLLAPGIPPWLDVFLTRALANSPANRFQSVAAMSQAIDLALQGEIKKTTPRRRFFRINQRATSSPSRSVARKPGAMRARLAATWARRAVAAREKRAALLRDIRRGFAAINPAVPSKRVVFKARTYARQISAAIKPAPMRVKLALFKTSGITRKFIMQKRANTGAFWERASAVELTGWVKRARAELHEWARSARNFAPMKKAMNSFSENSLYRYFAIAILALSLMIETFIFTRAHTPPNLETSLPPASRSHKTQTPAIPVIGITRLSADHEKTEPQAKIDKPTAKRQRNSDKLITANKDPHYQALDSKRTVTYRLPRETDNHILGPYPQEGRVAEAPRRITETNPTKTQLNVTWEN